MLSQLHSQFHRAPSFPVYALVRHHPGPSSPSAPLDSTFSPSPTLFSVHHGLPCLRLAPTSRQLHPGPPDMRCLRVSSALCGSPPQPAMSQEIASLVPPSRCPPWLHPPVTPPWILLAWQLPTSTPTWTGLPVFCLSEDAPSGRGGYCYASALF